jgi:hypothetical protein
LASLDGSFEVMTILAIHAKAGAIICRDNMVNKRVAGQGRHSSNECHERQVTHFGNMQVSSLDKR